MGIGYLFFAVQISFHDFRYRIIRNRQLLFFVLFSVMANFKYFNLQSLEQLLAVTIILAVLHLAFLRNIGAGDLKLFWTISLWSHSFNSWLLLFSLTWVLGGVVGGLFLLYSRNLKASIAFAPYIFLGFLPAIAT